MRLIPLGDWPLLEDVVDIAKIWGGRSVFDGHPPDWFGVQPGGLGIPDRALP